MSQRRVVLSVEDSDADFYVIAMALQECLPGLRLQRAADGEQAIKLLEELQTSSEEPLPDLVLLDRNLPRKDGFEVLTYLNAQNLTAKIPVVMFASAASPIERRQALDLGARDVIIKPADLDDLISRLKRICRQEMPQPAPAEGI